MQTRHQDRSAYFEETATSCRNYYLPYIEQHTSLKFGRKCRVMEVGCGIGGHGNGNRYSQTVNRNRKDTFRRKGVERNVYLFGYFRLQRHTTLRPDYPTLWVGAYSRKGAVDVAFKILSES